MKLRTLLLVSCAFAAPACAQSGNIEQRLDALQKTIEAQQAQIEAQQAEIATLKKSVTGEKGKTASSGTATSVAAVPEPPPAPEISTKLAQQQVKIDALTEQLEADENKARLDKQDSPVWSFAGGRPTITSADGRFSLAIRALVQYDQAYYMQGAKALSLAAANGPDLSSGGNFRRVWFGVQGKLFGEWSYNFNYDFGGTAKESPGHIQQVWLQYDGFGAASIRVGAFSPANGIEDGTGSSDTIFLERNAPADAARNIAGGDGRDAIAVTYAAHGLYGSIAYSGNKIADSGAFDEQQAVIGRLSSLLYDANGAKFIFSGGASYVFKAADTAAGYGAPRLLSISAGPEITVDNTGTKFVTSGSVNIEHAWEWGLEGATQWRSLYAQGGYFRYGMDLRSGSSAYGFDGWYAQASWILTSESRPYSAASGSFGSPKPRIPFSFNGGGWGAWELAARYSDLNLNDHAGSIGVTMPTGGVRGGDQKIWTLALNWYPVSALKFALQYQNIAIDRIGTIPASGSTAAQSNAQVGQTLNVLGLRTQVAF